MMKSNIKSSNPSYVIVKLTIQSFANKSIFIFGLGCIVVKYIFYPWIKGNLGIIFMFSIKIGYLNKIRLSNNF